MEPAALENSTVNECNEFVKIIGVVDGSSADEAGLKSDDIILSVNGSSVCSKKEDVLKDFIQFIKSQKINSSITLDILRGEEELFLTAVLGERAMRVQAEALHENLEECPDRASLLRKNLLAQDRLLLFNEIRTDLKYHSNLVHNPGWLLNNISNPFQLKEFTYMFRHPLRAEEAAREVTQGITDISGKNQGIPDMVNYLSLLIGMNVSLPECKDISLASLTEIIEEANKDIDTALSGLSEEERSLLRTKAVMPQDDENWNTVLELSQKIELDNLTNALLPLLSCLSNGNLDLLRKDLISRFRNTDLSILYETHTEFGKIIVGGMGPNTYEEDAALILDIGGNDVYLNNAGGTREKIPVAVVIDWEGDDHYITKEHISQGAGVLGGGVLIDLGGNDTFQALDGSQGSGLFGIGILYNSGGKTVFKARSYCQGTGQHGIGILWNNDSETLYQCSSYGQALGLFNAAGIILDENGNDHYFLGGIHPDFRDPARSTVSIGQGYGKGFRAEKDFDGISGGIGILIDKAGNDYYSADYFAQGSSYYFGVGILNDISGNDQYFAGRYAQGAGIHSSVGVLTDRSGDDFYYTSFGVSQGMGHDFGVGFLRDNHGNDKYTSGTLSQGAATNGGTGILLDAQGKDLYTLKDKGQAHAEEESGMGIMIDLEPSDDSVSSHTDILPVRIGVKKAGKRESGKVRK